MAIDPTASQVLNQVLDALAIGTVHLTESTLYGSSGLVFPDGATATCLHQLQEGTVWLDGPTIELQVIHPGDVAWVLRANGHRGRTSEHAHAVPLAEAQLDLGPGVSKRVRCGEGPLKARIFTSNIMWSAPDPHPLFDLFPSLFVLRKEEQDEGLQALLHLLEVERDSGAAGSPVVASRLTELLWIHLVRRAAREGLPEPGLLDGLSHPGVAKAMTAIGERPADAWTLEGLARIAGMSRTQFARTFRRRVGLTPFDYVRRWRVHRAQELLRDGRLPLDAVATEVGYASSVSFSRSFSAVTGVPPGQWRRQHTLT
ncbi:MAG: AraC family transcriptional regulator [Myxococcota bacterium]